MMQRCSNDWSVIVFVAKQVNGRVWMLLLLLPCEGFLLEKNIGGDSDGQTKSFVSNRTIQEHENRVPRRVLFQNIE